MQIVQLAQKHASHVNNQLHERHTSVMNSNVGRLWTGPVHM